MTHGTTDRTRRARPVDRARHHRRTTAASALALAAALGIGACSADATGHDGAAEHDKGAGDGAGMEVTGAYLPEPLMTDMAGGYFVVANHGEKDDELTKVTSGLAASVEIHHTTDGQMQRIDSLPVPAGGRLELRRGGNHLMFHDLERKPAEGDTVQVKLHFAHHDPVTVSVPVKATNHNPATAPPSQPATRPATGDGHHE